MVLPRQEKRGGEGNEEERAPQALADGGVELIERLGMGVQPFGDAARSVEDTEQGERPDREERDQLDHRFHGDGDDQPGVLFARGHVTGAEHHREGGDQDAEHQAQDGVAAAAGEDVHRRGDGSDLLRQVGEAAGEEEHGDHDAGAGAAVAEGEQIGERGELVLARQSQDRQPHHRDQEAGQGNAEVDGEEAIAFGAGEPDAAVIAPGAGVDAHGQRRYPRMVGEPLGKPTPLGGLGKKEQQPQVDEGDEEEETAIKRHRALATGSARRRGR